MNDITRIHIAKIPYDIEPSAKKQLEKYIKQVETYASDAELLQDIEVRITELLAERGVQANGVIASDDVAALREQLGEPSDFVDAGGDIATGPEATSDWSTRRLFRDTDRGVAGGVLAGIAAFFKLDPVWVRLVFIVLLFASFGTALVVYAVLWIVVPPARTAAEKLQLAGKPVNLSSIRELNDDEGVASENTTARVVKKVLMIGVGLLSACAAMGALLATIAGGWALLAVDRGTLIDPVFGTFVSAGGYEWVWWTVAVLMVVSGLLLTTLFSLLAFAAFAARFTRQMAVAVVVIILGGILTFSTAVGVGVTQSLRADNDARSALQTSIVNLPDNFGGVKKLTIQANAINIGWGDYADVQIEYVVDSRSRYELSALPGVRPQVAIDGDVARIIFTPEQTFSYQYASPTLKIYGPTLDVLEVDGGSVTYSSPEDQNILAIVANANSYVTTFGAYKTIQATSETASTINVSASSVEELMATTAVDGRIVAGTVRILIATQPDVCPSDIADDRTRIVVQAVTSGGITHNNTERAAAVYETPCSAVIIGDEDNFESRYDN